MTTNQDQERAEFEAAMREHGDYNLHRVENGGYTFTPAALGWHVWQAARRAPSVELKQATDIATWLWNRHYRQSAPQWEPAETLSVVLSQIDNMVCTLVAPSTPAVEPKDHEIRELVNRLRDIAVKFHDHQSLRERIANEVLPMFKAGSAQAGKCRTCNGHGLVGCMTQEGGEGWPCPECEGSGKAAADGAGELLHIGFEHVLEFKAVGYHSAQVIFDSQKKAAEFIEAGNAAIAANKGKDHADQAGE